MWFDLTLKIYQLSINTSKNNNDCGHKNKCAHLVYIHNMCYNYEVISQNDYVVKIAISDLKTSNKYWNILIYVFFTVIFM